MARGKCDVTFVEFFFSAVYELPQFRMNSAQRTRIASHFIFCRGKIYASLPLPTPTKLPGCYDVDKVLAHGLRSILAPSTSGTCVTIFIFQMDLTFPSRHVQDACSWERPRGFFDHSTASLYCMEVGSFDVEMPCLNKRGCAH